MQGSITRKRTRHGDFAAPAQLGAADLEDLFSWPRLSLHSGGGNSSCCCATVFESCTAAGAISADGLMENHNHKLKFLELGTAPGSVGFV